MKDGMEGVHGHDTLLTDLFKFSTQCLQFTRQGSQTGRGRGEEGRISGDASSVNKVQEVRVRCGEKSREGGAWFLEGVKAVSEDGSGGAPCGKDNTVNVFIEFHLAVHDDITVSLTKVVVKDVVGPVDLAQTHYSNL